MYHPTSHQKKWIIAVLALIMFTHAMDFMVLMPLGPKLMALFQISPHQFSLLVSVYSFAAGICGFLGSLLFDRLDRKRALIGAYIGFLFGTLSCALAPTFTILLIARALAGAFGGLLSGISFAIVGDLFTVHERGGAMGRLMTSFSLAAIIGVPTGLLIANHGGWHMTFFAIVAVGFIGLMLSIFKIPNVRGHLRTHYSGIFSGITDNLSDANSRIALITTFMMVLSQFVVIPFISTYLVTNTSFPETQLPLLYALGGLITAFTGPYVGKLCDQYSPRQIFTCTGLLFLLPVFVITHLGRVPVLATLVISTLFFILSNSRMVPAMTIISSSIPASRRGSFMSLNASLQQFGSALAALVGGWVVTSSPTSHELLGFSHTAYLSGAFGLMAYFYGRRINSIS